MADTFTSNRNIRKLAAGDTGYASLWAANLDLLDAIAALGALAVATAETPSASLNVKVSAGSFRKGDGTVVGYAGTAGQAMTASSTNYVFLNDAGTLVVNTTGFPVNCVRLATVVAGATTITSVTDAQVVLALGGAGTPTIAAGTGAGTTPTVAVTGSDRAGLISVTTGTSPAASAIVATVTFSVAFGAAPRAVILCPAGPNSAALSGVAAVYLDSASTTTAHFVLKVGSTNLAAATAYLWYFQVMP
jgi:uncharacterized membrane protein